MSKPLAHFKKGRVVKLSCYRSGCEGFSAMVTLGEEDEVHPFFSNNPGVGRFRWQPGAAIKEFELGETQGGSGYCACTICSKQFVKAIVVSSGRGNKPIVFGYEPEPA